MSSSSSSSPSFVPPLPTELILHILHLAYPPHAEDGYTGRSRDPLGGSQIDQLAQQPVLKRRLTHNLSVVPWLKATQARAALQLFTQVEHIRIGSSCESSDPGLVLSDFAFLSKLCPLAVTAKGGQTRLDTTVLPGLHSLKLLHGDYGNDTFAGLNSNSLPALRHLALSYFESDSTSDPLMDNLSVVEIVADQAEAHDVVFQRPFRSLLLRIDSSALFAFKLHPCFRASLTHPPRHFHYSSRISWPAFENIFLLPYRPESLFLPILSSSTTDAPATDNSARDAFLQRCKDEGVEVRWYRPAREEWREVGCRDFRGYVAERKRRQEERT
ncbi:hypothetical protein JCM8097_006607 [Rhodosporidiobolus ruineniae]